MPNNDKSLRDVARDLVDAIDQGATQPWDRPTHEHIWDRAERLDMPIVYDPTASVKTAYILFSPYDEDALDWQGSLECSCGKSTWLTDGRLAGHVTAEPTAEVGADEVPDDLTSTDVLAWLGELRAKLESGEEPTEDEKLRFNAVGAALAAAIEPLIEALKGMWEGVGQYIMAFIDLIPPAEREVLLKLSEAFDPAPTIELRAGLNDDVVATRIVSDEDQSILGHPLANPAYPGIVGPSPYSQMPEVIRGYGRSPMWER